MTELKWLVDMLLNNRLSPKVKSKFIARIGDVEASLFNSPPLKRPPLSPLANLQVPSMQAIVEALQLEDQKVIPIEQVAQTPEAAEALNKRNLAIQIATSGKPEPGRTSPRKF
jgi:hypothetical protein